MKPYFFILLAGIFSSLCSVKSYAEGSPATLRGNMDAARRYLIENGVPLHQVGRDEVPPVGQTKEYFKVEVGIYLMFFFDSTTDEIRNVYLLLVPQYRPSKVVDILLEISEFKALDDGGYSVHFVKGQKSR